MTQQEFLERFTYDVKTDRLGGGSFGTVYRAYDESRNRDVAIKIAEQKHHAGKTFSLASEWEAFNALPEHRNIAHYESVYQFAGPHGVYDYAVMQYYPAGNLKELYKQGLTDAQKTYLAEGIIDGVRHLHRHRIIHRDLKPSNILISAYRDMFVPKIADFGLSKINPDENASRFSASFGGGTLAYSAPEQLLGKPLRYNTDLWSVGVLLYELFLQERPFKASSNSSGSVSREYDIYDQIIEAPIPPQVENLPEPYRAIVKACLVKNPEQRVRDLDALDQQLAGGAASEIVELDEPAEVTPPPISASPAPNSTNIPPQGEPNRVLGRTGGSNPSTEEGATQIFGQTPPPASAKPAGPSPVQQPAVKAPKKKSGRGGQRAMLALVGALIAGAFGYFFLWNGGSFGSNQAGLFSGGLSAEEEAARQEEELRFNQLQGSSDPEEYETFISDYPEGIFITVVEESRDSLNAYLAEQEQLAEAAAAAAAAQEAQEAAEADDAAWNNARRINTAAAYRDYLIQYPNGTHAGEARRLRDERTPTRTTLSSYTNPVGTSFRYRGEVIGGVPNGRGTAAFRTGEEYEGQFVNGLRQGRGTYTAAEFTYTGQWRNDKRNGQGVFAWRNGDRYEGDFVDGDFHGRGTYTAREGYHITNCPDCTRYVGDWVSDARTGRGRCYDSNGRLLYSGRFRNGEPLDNYPNR